MIDAGTHAQPDRLEPGFPDQQEFVHGEIRGEDAAGMALAAQALEPFQRMLRNIVACHQIGPSPSLLSP